MLHNGTVTASLDMFANIDHKQLDTQIINILQEHSTKQLKNVIRFIVPAGTSNMIIRLLKGRMNTEQKASELSKENRTIIVKLLKELELTVEGLMGFEKAVIANGGVDLRDIDMRTMQSRKINNLYVTGDLLNITRPSGGYSLQLCWTTGYLAGVNC